MVKELGKLQWSKSIRYIHRLQINKKFHRQMLSLLINLYFWPIHLFNQTLHWLYWLHLFH